MLCRAYIAPCRRPCRSTAHKTTTLHDSLNKVVGSPHSTNSLPNACLAGYAISDLEFKVADNLGPKIKGFSNI